MTTTSEKTRQRLLEVCGEEGFTTPIDALLAVSSPEMSVNEWGGHYLDLGKAIETGHVASADFQADDGSSIILLVRTQDVAEWLEANR